MKYTADAFRRMKTQSLIAMLTAYDTPTARALELKYRKYNPPFYWKTILTTPKHPVISRPVVVNLS